MESSKENLVVSNAKEWLGGSNLNLEILKYINMIDCDNAILMNDKGRKAIEIPYVLIILS